MLELDIDPDLVERIPYKLNPVELRASLTKAYEAAAPDVASIRKACILILKDAWDRQRLSILNMLDQTSGGVNIARALSKCADEIIQALWDFTLTHVYRARNPTQGERLCLVAVGGYGRGELAPYSDLDLLFLRGWKETAHSESVIEFVLYSLWDLGLKVGHASRTVDETLKYARTDHTILTAVLEFRPIAGDVDLAQNLKDRLGSESLRALSHDFIAAKLEERDLRHMKQGDVRFVVEPNIKEGKGGLRDLHSLFWIARALADTIPSPVNKGWGALEAILTDKERQVFIRAFEFLWKIRLLIHMTAKRSEERLSFNLQPEIARRMGYIDRFGEPAVERFMRRYFMTAKDVGALTRIFCTKLEAQQARPLKRLTHMIQASLMSVTKPDHPGFIINEGRLSVQSPDIFTKNPVALISLFKMSDRLELDLHPDAFTAISRNLKLLTPTLRRDPKAARLFIDILVRGKNPYRTLSLMSETGLLGRYIPEFGRIVAQTQFNMYHAYTVDEHSLRAIGIIHDIEAGRLKDEHPMATSLMPQLSDKETLYLAMLLHDTGKGCEQGQEIGGEIAARKACIRLGLKTWQTDQVAWLVRHHLVLSDYAQKRDVSDPQTIESFAKIVQTPERLRLLLVLTVADIRAVGPGVWNGWKGQLMRDLLAATEAYFRGGRGPEAKASEIVANEPENLEGSAYALRAEVSAKAPHLATWVLGMEDAYVNSFPILEIMRHGELSLKAQIDICAVEAHIVTRRQATAFYIACKDRNGLFADLARVFSDVQANVVGAQVFTSSEGMALDIVYVQDALGGPYGLPARAVIEQTRTRLIRAALNQNEPRLMDNIHNLPSRTAAFAIAPTVVFDDHARQKATIIEVSGRDRPGLLADLARALSHLHLNIASAHIDCYGERAVDAFYVTSHDGRLNKTQKAAVKKELLLILEPKLQTSMKGLARAKASLAR
jgi:[protein-PII] uridylyltransferase